LRSFGLNCRTLVRALLASAAIAASFALAGCDGESLSTNAKANKPIPEKLVNEMDQKNMDKQSPMLVRLFKQEAELEVWKQDRNGQYALLRTYPICRWSGDLGPKVKEGDRQAPEGFYTISPTQMNPQSAYYLSFNIGYPNAFDRALGRTGSQLMVHGDCSSRGCYAMTDEQISEIYSLGRESFFGGQRAFQVQAYPFRMTAQNMAKHRNNPNMPFWKMIKEGSDHFEVTRQEPKVDVCEKHYVFDAQAPAGSNKPLTFNPTGACPAYQIPDEIADAVRDKQRNDETKTAELITRGTPAAKLNTGIDGGMNAIFASKLPDGQTGLSEPTSSYANNSFVAAPGTIPPTVNPPRAPEPPASEAFLAAPATTAATPAARLATASDGGSSTGGGGFFSSLAKKVGLGGSDTTATTTPAATKPVAKMAAPPKPPAMVATNKPAVAVPKISETRIPELRTADQKITDPKRALPPRQIITQAQAKPAAAAAAPADQSIAGAQPVVPSNSFESRWSSYR
jgi:murein L,D-transpeptidase YafK